MSDAVSHTTTKALTAAQIIARAFPIPDSTVWMEGSADATKLLRFEIDGFTTATTRTKTLANADGIFAESAAALTNARLPRGTSTAGVLSDSGIADGTTASAVLTLSASASYTLTVPATGTAGLLGVAATWSATQTFSAATGMAAGSVGTPGVYLGSSTGSGWFQPSANAWEWSGSGVGRFRLATSGVNIYNLNATTISGLGTSSFSNTAFNCHGADSTGLNIAGMTYTGDMMFIGRVSGGTGAVPAATPSGQQLGFVMRGHTGSGFTSADRGGFYVLATETWSTTANGTKAQIKVTPIGALTTAVAVEVGSDSSVTTAGARFMPVRSVATAAGVTAGAATDHVVVFTGITTQTYTLPAAAAGRSIIIKNRSTGIVTVNRAGADTIDGLTTFALTANQAKHIVANGTDWCIVSDA